MLACKGDPEDGAIFSVQTDLGTWTAASGAPWPGVALTPNLDDDDGDEAPDYEQSRLDDGDDDFAEVAITATNGFEVTLTSPDDAFRIWWDGDVLMSDDGAMASFGARDEAVVFQVEAGDYLAEASLMITDQVTGDTISLPLTASPLIVNHHLQPSELVMSVSFVSPTFNNSDMIDGYEAVLGESFMSVSGGKYPDPWIQDEIEFATSSSPLTRLDTVMDSIRDGQWGPGEGLDDFPEDEFLGEGWAVGTWGRGFTQSTSQDYFGNLEVIPPHSAGGVDYPFGRLYYGLNGNLTPNQEIRDFLDDQKVQAPFTLDVSWLCVGHVDEFLTTVPAPGSRLGWKLVYTDTELAWEILEAQPADMALTRFASSSVKHWDTVGDMVADDALRTLNEELERDYLKPNLDVLIETLELTDDDIIFVPGLFEEVSMCGGTTAAAFPGMANLIVADAPDGTTTLFVPDPFVRTDLDDVSSDPIATAFADAMPPELDVVFLDDWNVYHVNLGEVHCGSNVVRTPSEDAVWWEDARHLLESE